MRLVVPFAAGGGVDSVTRVVAHQLNKAWNQPVIVDNRPGADSIIGTTEAVRADPDGRTVLVTISQLVQNPTLRTKLPFDTFRDLVPVTSLASDPLFLVVTEAAGTPDLTAFLKKCRAEPGRVSFGSFGNGSTAHLLLIGLRRAAGADILHVPYRGSAPVGQALMSGEIQSGLLPYSTARSILETGKVKAIGVTGTERAKLLPDVPTFSERGVAGFDRQNWIGLFLPSATPAPIVEKLGRDVIEALRVPDVVSRLTEAGSIVGGEPRAAFSEMVKQDYTYWASLIHAGNVRVGD